jgi:3-methyladenine DNA glycosylase AlkD
MASGISHFVDELERGFRAGATPERAAEEKRYLKSELEFLGASFWETGRLAKALARRERFDHEGAVALAVELWERPVFERRAAAVTILEVCVDALGPTDLALVEHLVRESGTWALVDGLAADVAGSIVARFPDEASATLDRWAADPDFWVRRTSLLAELRPLRGGATFDRFARHADAMLEEGEFFIRKAIGWVLRETGKRRPAEVVAWLAPRTGRASGVTMREAVKYLPAQDAQRLMAAYREHRPSV